MVFGESFSILKLSEKVYYLKIKHDYSLCFIVHERVNFFLNLDRVLNFTRIPT